MKLSAALTKLKNLKSQLARVDKYMNVSMIHDEDEMPAHDFAVLLSERNQLLTDVLELKASIMQANARTIVQYDNKMVSVNWLILKNAELRSELAWWQEKADTKPSYSSFGERTKDTIKKVLNKSFDPAAARLRVETLEAEKERLEAAMAEANQNTDI